MSKGDSHHREVIKFLREAGAERPRIEFTGGRHPRVVFLWRGEELKLPISGSPSDGSRATVKKVCELRRLMGLQEGY